MAIKAGELLPDVTLTTMTAEGPTQIGSKGFFAGKKAVLIGVPGAFTPTCHNKHLPGFIAKVDELKAKGVDLIACVSVNDVHVMNAWAKHLGAQSQISFLADGNGEMTRAIGMQRDASDAGMGERSKRYVVIVDDARVSAVYEEAATGIVEESSVENVLSVL